LVGVGVAGLMLVGARLRSRRTLFARLTSTAS
jgi:hypothetical protein